MQIDKLQTEGHCLGQITVFQQRNCKGNTYMWRKKNL